MRAALLALLLAGALAQDEEPPFDVSNLELSGEGCPADTYDIDIMSMGGFIFHAFNATLDGAASVSCMAQIGLEVREGDRVLLTQIGVSGSAGLDTGVVARVNTSTSWDSEEASLREDEQVLYGSAVGVDFPTSWIANPMYDDQRSACGPGTVLLSIGVEVELAREEGEGAGIVTVDFTGLRIGPEECGSEEDGEAPDEETPVEEPAPVEEDAPEEGGESEDDSQDSEEGVPDDEESHEEVTEDEESQEEVGEDEEGSEETGDE